MTEGPKIVLPEDARLKAKLERKLEEYRGRMSKIKEEGDNKFKHPELLFQINGSYRGACYKASILERLLETGEVNTWDISKELATEYGTFDVQRFNNAAGVIDDYCTTGGKNCSGGTGF